ncbi:uncharacterized protein LOC132250110 [Alligator mississippiensis]|uniref:uncharacterized protein LOC132250110 n=1 Tax=Alligator mississippiensis TaxID=8496 RepID=UPI0028779829|nr:uncharacterized protein LOC132250110 [Alligator mississippiensis]
MPCTPAPGRAARGDPQTMGRAGWCPSVLRPVPAPRGSAAPRPCRAPSMSADVWVGPWRPHRPRGPIAALYSSPGPKYGLPTDVDYQLQDASRFRAPACSFGLRRLQQEDDCSPGPAYMLFAKTTMRGKDGTPAYSIHGRPRDLQSFCTPGPGQPCRQPGPRGTAGPWGRSWLQEQGWGAAPAPAGGTAGLGAGAGCHYYPEKAGKWAFPTAPIYSLASRTKEFSNDRTPGLTHCPESHQGPRLAVVMGVYMARMDTVSDECPFCHQRKTLAHTVIECARLEPLHLLLQSLLLTLWLHYSPHLLVYAHPIRALLVNLLLPLAKLVIWLSRREALARKAPGHLGAFFLGVLRARLWAEHRWAVAAGELPQFESR